MTEGVGLLICGVIVILLAVLAFLWYRSELNYYYENLVNRYDVREFLERTPKRPGPESILVFAILIGTIGLAIAGIGLYFTLV